MTDLGILTAKSALSGNPPVGSYPADAATNRLVGGGYDANGNYLVGTYDVSNRLVLVNGRAGAQRLFE